MAKTKVERGTRASSREAAAPTSRQAAPPMPALPGRVRSHLVPRALVTDTNIIQTQPKP